MATTTGYIDYTEGSVPTTPATGHWRVYTKSDGLYVVDDAGTETGPLVSAAGSGAVATDAIWDAAGDLAVGTGANTAAKLTKGAAGTVPTAGASTLAYAYPPGYAFDHTEYTSPVLITATSEATATTIVTASAVSYDGSTPIIVEYFAPYYQPGTSNVTVVLYDGSSSIGKLTVIIQSSEYLPILLRQRLTPSNASHTYSIRAYVNSVTTSYAGAGAGGSGNYVPGYIRQVMA